MTVGEGLEVVLVASEPMVRQPVAIEFDDLGRPWVIQYLQYPNPAGLGRVSVDRYSRTVYDRTPEAPPRGPRGDDRLTILEDVDGDGRADQSKDFVTGLNLASGLAFGRGGVFVLNAPYLLFYPDRDGDDVPDSDPEVLLTGFGLEDAHSVANSLTWGPDGWLYGLQGSTVTARIRGVEFQQGVWRYHPVTREFELFSEGGGNMWGLDFDRRGELFASTNVGGNVMLHMVQGGYYWKQFGKHGPLHNPYTFGYFDHVPHAGVRGGHVAVGGLFYQADALPESYRGQYLAADLLDHSVHRHEVAPLGSTFRARQVGDLLHANDTWFAQSDMTLGPDGALYLTDWHDRRTAHPDPDADWDRTNGRVFAVRAAGSRGPAAPLDLPSCPTAKLLDLLGDPNSWVARRARRLLVERGDPDALPRLRSALLDGEPRIPRLEALWTLHGASALDASLASRLLDDPEEDVRLWAVRLLGDARDVTDEQAVRLRGLASTDPSVRVRSQLAGTAARLPAGLGLDLAGRILSRDLDGDDPFVPLRLWWAVERHAAVDLAAVVGRFVEPQAWRSGLTRRVIQPRLVRRLAAEGTPVGDDACARLLDSAPSVEDARALLSALDETLRGRRTGAVAPALARAASDWLAADPTDPATIRVAARLGDGGALATVRTIAFGESSDNTARIGMIELLGDLRDAGCVAPLLRLATGEAPAPVASAALAALGRLGDDAVARALLDAYPGRDASWRQRTRDVLLSRAPWASEFVRAVDRGRIDPAEIPLDQVRRLASLGDPELDDLVRRQWGKVTATTSESRLAEVRRLNNDLNAGTGDPSRGLVLFREHCAPCHKLFGEGHAIGPDLTHANRQDRQFLLVSLVDPNDLIRKEYQATTVVTRDGRVVTGLIAERSPDLVILVAAGGERTAVRDDEIEELTDAPVSLMPEDLYRRLSPAQLRDLFAFLQAP